MSVRVFPSVRKSFYHLIRYFCCRHWVLVGYINLNLVFIFQISLTGRSFPLCINQVWQLTYGVYFYSHQQQPKYKCQPNTKQKLQQEQTIWTCNLEKVDSFWSQYYLEDPATHSLFHSCTTCNFINSHWKLKVTYITYCFCKIKQVTKQNHSSNIDNYQTYFATTILYQTYFATIIATDWGNNLAEVRLVILPVRITCVIMHHGYHETLDFSPHEKSI